MDELVLIDEMYGRVFELPPGESTVGRSEDCDITIPRGSVALRHAVLEAVEGCLTLRDNDSTNGTYLQRAGAGNPNRIGTQPQPLTTGDVIHIGPARLVIRSADWVGDGPPGPLPVGPSDRGHEVLDAVRAGESARQFSVEDRDAAWVVAYDRWRGLPASEAIFEMAVELCSPKMLVAIRDALDDPVRWFVDFGLAGVDLFFETDHPIGYVIALDVRLRHTGRGFREAAGRGLRKTAQRASSSISQLSTTRFLEAASIAGPEADDTLFERLASDVVESARKEGRAWDHKTWARLMQCRPFVTAAASFVFVARDSGATFRPENGELLGIEGHVELGSREAVGVALELDAAWSEHLADYEVVQPFTQQI